MRDSISTSLSDSIHSVLFSFILEHDDSETLEMLAEAGPLLEEFCRLCETSLVFVAQTREKGFIEPVYYFTDRLGGYTVEGIRRSVRLKYN